MNVERLHRILIDLDQIIKKDNLIQLLSQVRDHLQNQVNQPNQPSHQNHQEFFELRSEMSVKNLK